jgi:integrase
MRVYKRGAVYWFELVYGGKRYQRTTSCNNVRTANIIASSFLTALAKGDVGIIDRKPFPSFKDALAGFLHWSTLEHQDHPATALRYRTSSKALLGFFRQNSIDKITPQDVESFKLHRSSQKGVRTQRRIKPATVNRELACLRAMFNHAIKGHAFLRNPVDGIKFLPENNEQDRVLTFTEEAAYLAAASPMLRDVAGLILQTGMRPGEVYALEASHVSLADESLRVVRGKTKAARRKLRLSSEAAQILARRLKLHPSGFLFPCDTDPGRPVPKMNNAHASALRASKLPPFRIYDLRHTWATRAAEIVDVPTLAAMLGHSKIHMVMRYVHPSQDHQSSATDKIERHNAIKRAAEQETQAAEQAATGIAIVRRKA